MGTITSFPAAPLGYTPTNTVAFASVVTALSGVASVGADTFYTGLAASVVVPEGRRLRITTFVCMSASVTGYLQAGIQQDGVLLERSYFNNVTGGQIVTHCFSAVVTPTAGAHTYRAVVNSGAGTITTYPASFAPDWILVEDITGQPGPVPPASVPVGQLAYAQIVANSATFTAIADVVGLSVNVVVPAGRSIRVSAFVNIATSSGTPNYGTVFLYEGATELQKWTVDTPLAQAETTHPTVVLSPSAGSHTYKVMASVDTGVGIIGANANEPGWILVEDITPTPVPATTVPSSTLAYIENLGHNTTVTTDPTDIPGMAVTFTVPAGRRVLVTAKQHISTSVAGDRVILKLAEGGTVLNASYMTLGMAASGEDLFVSHVLTPSAGTHTYKLQAGRSIGTGALTTYTQAGTTSNYLMVEDITGVGLLTPQFNDSGWIAPTLTNGWLNYDITTYSAAAYRKIGSVVYLRGLVKSGTVGAGSTAYIFQLPAGFRPPKNLQLICASNATQTSSQASYVEMMSDGGVRASVGSNVWFSLELLYFFVD